MLYTCKKCCMCLSTIVPMLTVVCCISTIYVATTCLTIADNAHLHCLMSELMLSRICRHIGSNFNIEYRYIEMLLVPCLPSCVSGSVSWRRHSYRPVRRYCSIPTRSSRTLSPAGTVTMVTRFHCQYSNH